MTVRFVWTGLFAACVASGLFATGASADICTGRTVVSADVVALDQALWINRLGTMRPDGMIYALRSDVVPIGGNDPTVSAGPPQLKAGEVMLRAERRPRPIVLRARAGDCLRIRFQNLTQPDQEKLAPGRPVTPTVGIHVAGLEWTASAGDDGTFSGKNVSSLAAPGSAAQTYTLFAAKEGSYLLYSSASDFNGFGVNQMTVGLFGSVTVEPASAEIYRSQVTESDLRLATRHDKGKPVQTSDGHPLIDYDARYPADYDQAKAVYPRHSVHLACTPILRMLAAPYIVQGGGCVPKDGPEQLTTYYTELTAVVTGKAHGRFEGVEGPDYAKNPAEPDRRSPFREITVIYHESQDVVQPFPQFFGNNTPDPVTGVPIGYALSKGQDGFAINYGIAGIGPEVFANRLRTGPSADCVECKYEEFFLNSWTNGDPAMLVTRPTYNPAPPLGALPNHALFPDDPSNVFHAYLGDRTRFQILHAGNSVHHVHHHHAHQWLRSPNSDESHYLDSQAIGPGSSFTLELVYNGAGNRNLTAGDSIFHCHFYPHFAAGMWALFRVHDVFEAGTELDTDGQPRTGARALPDGEIARGTPIPAVIPLPTRAMAPLPAPVQLVTHGTQAQTLGKGNPGFPFFVPGIAGHRSPHPPMDFAKDDKGVAYDGGLPRHVIAGGEVAFEAHTAYDFTKETRSLKALLIDENGTPTEKAAMAAHSTRVHPSFTPEGRPADFLMNGQPPVQGAPFANPGVDDQGKPVGTPRRYMGADIQVNAVFNKKGWHYPQQRILSLWNDVMPTLNGERPPEPLFFRANSGDVVEYWQTNLVPSYYEMDDFQVRTPTDILGQHIHLVKFDVLSSDGAANGFNYEDGTFSPDEVRDRIAKISAKDGSLGYWTEPGTTPDAKRKPPTLAAKSIPYFGDGPSGKWKGAQATVQRWYVDPLLDAKGADRTITTVFTHDHFGPSTHQQVGLYGALVVEPTGSRWLANGDGKPLGDESGKPLPPPNNCSTPGVARSCDDGGPTSASAIIATADRAKSYREFLLEWQDTQLAYANTSRIAPDCYGGTPVDPANRVDCSAHPDSPLCALSCVKPAGAFQSDVYLGWASHTKDVTQPLTPPTAICSGTCLGPQPEMVSDFGAGIMSLNYRAESLAQRVAPAGSPRTATGAGPVCTPGPEGSDLSHAFRSICRPDPAFRAQPAGGSQIDPNCTPTQTMTSAKAACFTFPKAPLSPGMGALDPYTPLLRAYPDDDVQVRVLAGGFTTMHDFTIHGVKWLSEPGYADSGWRNSQFVVLSEHFEMSFKLPPVSAGAGAVLDRLYDPGSSYEGLVNGLWGLMRTYSQKQKDLYPLPQNPPASRPPVALLSPPAVMKACGLPDKVKDSCIRTFTVVAKPAPITFNDRGITLLDKTGKPYTDGTEPIRDPNGMIYVLEDELDANGNFKKPTNPEPLVVRVAAGDWLRVTLKNRFRATDKVFTLTQDAGKNGQIGYGAAYSKINLKASPSVGLHPQLLAYDLAQSDGANVGQNPVQTAAPGGSVTYTWYAGTVQWPAGTGAPQMTPVEFGATNLMPSDRLVHPYRGLFGALIVEPQGATWEVDPGMHASATVTTRDGKQFRDFVLISQDDSSMEVNGVNLYAGGNPQSAFNYRSEPMFYRFGATVGNLGSSGPPTNWANLNGKTGSAADASSESTVAGFSWSTFDTTLAVSNQLVGGKDGKDPVTPIFTAPAGMPCRFRLLASGGIGDNQEVFELAGHVWQEEPYTKGSTEIGDNPRSPWTGTTPLYGPTAHYDVVIASAGGANKVPGDYLYRSATAAQFQSGLFGILRVLPAPGSAAPEVGVTAKAGEPQIHIKPSTHPPGHYQIKRRKSLPKAH